MVSTSSNVTEILPEPTFIPVTDESQEAIIHVWNCFSCRNKLNIAEYILLLNVHRNNSAHFNELQLLKTIYRLVTNRDPTVESMIKFLKYLNEYFDSIRIFELYYLRTLASSELYSYKFRVSSHSERAVCTICLNQFEETQSIHRVINCSHEFHATCLDEWLKVKPMCPLCRLKIHRERVFSWCTV